MSYRTTPKMARRKEAHRAKLLRAAIRLFGRRGYHATTVPMIVKASGGSTGAFYLYFRNKEDVFAAAMEVVGQQIAGALNGAIARAGDDVISQMREAVSSLVHFLALHPAEAKILIIESSGLTSRLAAVRRAVIASHCRSVERAISSLGRAPGMNPKVAAHCWVGAVHESIYQWLEIAEKDRVAPEFLAKDIALFNLRGIGVQKEVP